MRKLVGGAGVLTGLAILAIATTAALATPARDVASETLAEGILDPIKLKTKIGEWESEIQTEGQTNMVVTRLVVKPGGHFGWHSHPGPSLVIVRAGTSTFYRGDDPTCTGETHAAGTAYVDPGGVVHTARNESATQDLVLVVMRLLPPGTQARLDAPAPGNCDF